jgi:hypothetical protein
MLGLSFDLSVAAIVRRLIVKMTEKKNSARLRRDNYTPSAEVTSLMACEACAGVGELVLTGRIGLKPGRRPVHFSSSPISPPSDNSLFHQKVHLGMEVAMSRRRQIRACPRCRTLKVRSDTQRPICARCAKAGARCVFLPEVVAPEEAMVDQRVASDAGQELPNAVRPPMASNLGLTVD